jgi:3',5'-cyclic-AMP phosphodiesterase
VRHVFAFYLLSFVGLLSACDHPFSFSPFEVRLPEALRNTNEKNLKRIAALDSIRDDSVVTIALLADTHYHFNALADALEVINSGDSVDFIIVTGDFTENGLQKEYELFHQIMAKSSRPYVTVIGNHDYLSNGGEVYRQMFGAFNYSFIYAGTKFVMWDNVLWESNKTPDWKWLRETLGDPADISDRNKPVRHVIPFSHIPPTDGQLKDSAQVYHQLLHRHGIELSVHGHKHRYSNALHYGNGIRYVTVGSPQKRGFAQLIIRRDKISVRKIEY